MGLIRCVRGWPLRALPTNLSFQPDDGLGSNGHPGAAAILINQKNGERLVWEWERVNSIWGKNFCIFPAGRRRSSKDMGERKFGKWGVYLRASDPRGSARWGIREGGWGRRRTSSCPVWGRRERRDGDSGQWMGEVISRRPAAKCRRNLGGSN